MKRLYFFLIPVFVLFVSACSSKSDYYMLEPQSAHKVKSSSLSRRDIVGVAEVTVADYLDKPQIVTRTGNGRMVIHETERWVGSFDKNIQSFVATVLQEKLPRFTILKAPWREPVEDKYRIYLSVDRFDGDGNGSVRLSGHWSVSQREENRLLAVRSFDYTIAKANADDIRMRSVALERLSTDMATKLDRILR